MRIYIDTPDELCFERRMKRDIEQRGRTEESVRRQYEATVRPSLAFYNTCEEIDRMVSVLVKLSDRRPGPKIPG